MRAFQIAAVAVALAVLVGCAIGAKVISSSPRTVVVRAGDARVQEAQNLADQECGKHQRHARLTQSPTPDSSNFVYDCVN